jgi:putative protein-disulfide isomerase
MKGLVSIIFFLVMNLNLSQSQNASKVKLIYVYDALCGWCYGFSPVIEKFYSNHTTELDVEVISGGMITGNRTGEIGKVASYISLAYKEVENASGVKFGEHFLNHTLKKGTAIFTSIPPAIALSAFKFFQPQNSLAFASTLQKAIYFEGIEPMAINEYGRLVKVYGIDSALFVSKMQDTTIVQLALADFEMSGKLGVTGFPTVFIEQNGKLELLTQGFVSLAILESKFKSLKRK